MKIKLNTGITVRVKEGDTSDSFRRVGEAGDVVDVSAVPEWGGEVPVWLFEQGLVEKVEDGSPFQPVFDGEE